MPWTTTSMFLSFSFGTWHGTHDMAAWWRRQIDGAPGDCPSCQYIEPSLQRTSITISVMKKQYQPLRVIVIKARLVDIHSEQWIRSSLVVLYLSNCAKAKPSLLKSNMATWMWSSEFDPHLVLHTFDLVPHLRYA